MRPLFTEFVSGLGEAPDRRLFAATWNRLRALLRAELNRRGLWESSPNYLGVYGWRRWDEPGEDGTARLVHDDALEELTAECYAFIFVARIWSLKAQLKVKPNIEGLILLNVRHFLHERQREHDPLGFRIYETVQAAVCEAVSRGELLILAGDCRVRNDTLLGFDAAREAEAILPELAGLVARWNDDLMPALVTAKGCEQKMVRDRLRDHLLSLRRHGVRSFRFKNVIDPLKLDARARWASLLGAAGGEGQELRQPLRPALPQAVIESRQDFAWLARSVSAAIDALETEPQTKAQLARLWQHLCRHAAEEPSGPGAGGEEVLSQRLLAKLLGIRRARLPELFRLLRTLVSQCRESRPTAAAADPPAAARRARGEAAISARPHPSRPATGGVS